MPKYRFTPRNNIRVEDKLPQRYEFLAVQNELTYAWKSLLERIDTIAEHADALSVSNGIDPDKAVRQAITNIIDDEKRNNYVTREYWILTPTHIQAIIHFLENP